MAFVGAVAFAKIMHGDQKRKSFNSPFISHPMAVASLVMEYGQFEPDDEVVQAALLHDIVEDTPVKLVHLANEFSPRVAAIVNELTHAEGQSGRLKRLSYLEVMENTEEPATLLISACDKLDNMRSIIHSIHIGDGEAYRGGMWFYHDLFDIYRRRQVSPLLLLEYEHTLQRVTELFDAELV